jgi:hypothetical protein
MVTTGGTIKLYRISYGGLDDDLISVRQYKKRSERDSIIEKWERIYASGLKSCYFQIEPETDDFLIGKNGENGKFLKDKAR